jgi:hypothetical protein
MPPKHIVAINGSPRKGYTQKLIKDIVALLGWVFYQAFDRYVRPINPY